jgi:hypothetical protein
MILLSVFGRIENISLGYKRDSYPAIFLFWKCGHPGGCCKSCPVAHLATSEHGQKQMQAHAMTPFLGAGAGQAIEVSLSMIFSVQSILMI